MACLQHIMFDLETLGLDTGCTILSIGAVRFHPLDYYNVGETFYVNIDRESCFKYGLVESVGALRWWSDPSLLEAKKKFSEPPLLDLKEALKSFSKFYGTDGDTKLWSNSDFDVPIICHAMQKAGVYIPWKYTATRDVRTIYSLCERSVTEHITPVIEHYALDDAIAQAYAVQEIFKKLNLKKFNGNL